MERYREALKLLNLAHDLLMQEGETLAVAELATPIHLVQTALSRAVIRFSPTAV